MSFAVLPQSSVMISRRHAPEFISYSYMWLQVDLIHPPTPTRLCLAQFQWTLGRAALPIGCGPDEQWVRRLGYRRTSAGFQRYSAVNHIRLRAHQGFQRTVHRVSTVLPPGVAFCFFPIHIWQYHPGRI